MDFRCWMLDVGHWMLDIGYPESQIQDPKSNFHSSLFEEQFEGFDGMVPHFGLE